MPCKSATGVFYALTLLLLLPVSAGAQPFSITPYWSWDPAGEVSGWARMHSPLYSEPHFAVGCMWCFPGPDPVGEVRLMKVQSDGSVVEVWSQAGELPNGLVTDFGQNVIQIPDSPDPNDGDNLPEVMVSAWNWWQYTFGSWNTRTYGKVYVLSSVDGDTIWTMDGNRIAEQLTGVTDTVFPGFGTVLEEIGDWNDDGNPDILITCGGHGNYEPGHVFVLDATMLNKSVWPKNGPLPPGAVLAHIEGPWLFGANGWAGGDFNGDGMNDIIILQGDWGDPGTVSKGYVYGYGGLAGTKDGSYNLLLTVNEPTNAIEFPRAAAFIDDIDGDGFRDIALVEQKPYPTRIYFYYSGTRVGTTVLDPDADYDELLEAPDWGFPTTEHGMAIGIANLGDVDGDGEPEILINQWHDVGVFAWMAITFWEHNSNHFENYYGIQANQPYPGLLFNLGDVTGDGYVDVGVNQASNAFVFQVSPDEDADGVMDAYDDCIDQDGDHYGDTSLYGAFAASGPDCFNGVDDCPHQPNPCIVLEPVGHLTEYSLFSPVDMVITDPAGDSIGIGFNTIGAGSDYDTLTDANSSDLTGPDGDPDDIVTIPTPWAGDYTIRIIREPGAGDDEKFTLSIRINGNQMFTPDGYYDQPVSALGSTVPDTYVYTVATTLPGDVNADGVMTAADIIYMVGYVFKGGPPPSVPGHCDVNCDGSDTSADIISMVGFVFKSGNPPCSQTVK